MHVEVFAEGIEEPRVAGQVRHDAQLDLRIVRRDDAVAFRRHEGLADTPPVLGTDGDVLQVRVTGREPPCGGDRLVEGRVDPSGPLVDQPGQGLHVCALELREAAVLDDHLWQRIVESQLLKDFLGR